ncbi:MAG: class I adenylate-forming enzyme family protein [Gemmatimonadota bacterium]|jgi:O-succinylbenzoic acid--CoA ligase
MAFLDDASLSHPSQVALEDEIGHLTYQEVYSLASETARELRAAGIGPGSVVGVSGGLDRKTVLTLHAIWMAGASVAPLNQRWTARESGIALELLRPSHLLEGLTPESPGELSSDPLPGLPKGTEAARLLTSGTSGRPRVVRLSAGNLRANADASCERLGLDPSDRWLASLSPAHVGGLALIIRAGLLGSTLVLRGAFSVSSFVGLLGNGAVTHASLVPTMLHQVLESWGDRAPPRSLRCLLIGGAPASKTLIKRALGAGFPIALTYGLTEASSQVATAPPRLVQEKPGTVGPPLPGIQTRIGREGELLVRGPTVALGEGGSEGWLNTGDLAKIDEAGHLWIVGRQSDRIISGGVNVDPLEVEELLQTHPSVKEAVVTGVPDVEWGERVVAGVVTGVPAWGLEEELERLARSALSPAKRPRDIRILPAIPRNPNGKVDRSGLKALFQ